MDARAKVFVFAILLAACSAPAPDDSVARLSLADSLPNNAALLDASELPALMTCNEERTVSLLYINTGVSTWLPDHHKLGAVGDHDPLGGPDRVDIDEEVEPVEQHRFIFTLHAPDEPGTYTTAWRMLEENVQWFGQTASRNVDVQCPPEPDLDEDELSSDFPAAIACSEHFVVHVNVRNTGNTNWFSSSDGQHGYSLRLTEGSVVLGESVYRFPAGVTIHPGEDYTFTLFLHSPAPEGDYPVGFRMFNDSRHAFFGGPLEYMLHVSCVQDNAYLVERTLADQVGCGDPYPIHLVFQNTGHATWTIQNGYRLANSGDQQRFFPHINRVDLPINAHVAPNETATFDFLLYAPDQPGAGYVQAWRMIHEGGGGFFGSLMSQTVSVTCAPDVAELMGVELIDSLACGATATALVTLKNRGSATWGPNYRLLSVGDPLGPSVAIPAGTSVPPGGTYTFHADIAAPYAAGPRHLAWKLSHDGVGAFGPTAMRDLTLGCPWRDARVVSVTGQLADECGNQVPFVVTMKNAGLMPWGVSAGSVDSAADAVSLSAIAAPGFAVTPAAVPVPIGAAVRSGETYSFPVVVTRTDPNIRPKPSMHAVSLRMSFDPAQPDPSLGPGPHYFGDTAHPRFTLCR